MTKEQIAIYEYCKTHLEDIKAWKEKLPFKNQKYGCGTGSERITFTLENIHQKMYSEVYTALNKASKEIQEIIDKN